MKKKVSFDFDETLSTWRGQEYAKELINRGYEVWICTARFENPINKLFGKNENLFKLADEIGIKHEHIKFMNFEDKYHFFKENEDFIFHLDDQYEEKDMINKECEKVKGVWFIGDKWKDQCEEILKVE